jgi:hypothetical protein
VPLDDGENLLRRAVSVRFFGLAEIAHEALHPRMDDETMNWNPLAAHDRCMEWYDATANPLPTLLGNDVFAEFLQ